MWAMIYKYTHSSTPWSLNRVEALVDLEGIEPSLRVYKTRVLTVERQIRFLELYQIFSEFGALGDFGFNQFTGPAVFEAGQLNDCLGYFFVFHAFQLTDIFFHIN